MGLEEQAIAAAEAIRVVREQAISRVDQQATRRREAQEQATLAEALSKLSWWRRTTDLVDIPEESLSSRFEWIPHRRLEDFCGADHDVVTCVLSWNQDGYQFEGRLMHLYNGTMEDERSWLKLSPPEHFQNDNFAVRVMIDAKWAAAGSLAEIGEAILKAKSEAEG